MNKHLYHGLQKLGAKSPAMVLETMVTDAELLAVVRPLFIPGQYSRAVEAAFKFMNCLVKARASLESDGADLMRRAFSGKQPLLRINNLRTDSDESEQRGYAELFASSMIAFRNPRAHEYLNLDTDVEALALIMWANHLVLRVRRANSLTGEHTNRGPSHT